MIELAFEVWRSETENSFSCWLPSSHNHSLFRTISPDGCVVHVIYGSSTDDVMTKYYLWHGWAETWKPVAGYTDQPFTADQLREQTALRPAYYEAIP